jgi:AAA domain
VTGGAPAGAPLPEPDRYNPDDSFDAGPSLVGLTPDERARAIADWARALDAANGVEHVERATNDDLLDGIRNGAWLDAQDFPPLRYAVPGLVPEGLSLMVGAPKIGKSWWTLDSCLAVSSGGYALGRIHTGTPRPVLYLALEDSDRRMQDRCRQLLDGAPIPPRFDYMTRVASPGDVTLTVAAWLAWHRDEQPLVVIDTLGKAMPLASQGETVYQRDYRIMSDLKGLCDAEPGSTIVVNHHDRKAAADDFVDFVSGTNGLAGGADTVLVLSRDRGEHAGLLRVTGRDVAEGAYALTLVPGTWWRLDGANLEEAAAVARTLQVSAGLGDKAAGIIAYIGQHPDGVRADDIAVEFDMPTNAARVYLSRLHDANRLQRQRRGIYTPVASVASVASEPGATSERNTNNVRNTPTGRPVVTSRNPLALAQCPECRLIGWLRRSAGGYLCSACQTLSPLELVHT